MSNFPGKVLQATDGRKVTFLDVLIECDQKMVVSNAAVSFIVVFQTALCLYNDDDDD